MTGTEYLMMVTVISWGITLYAWTIKQFTKKETELHQIMGVISFVLFIILSFTIASNT